MMAYLLVQVRLGWATLPLEDPRHEGPLHLLPLNASSLSAEGLSSKQAAARLLETGHNEIGSERTLSRARVLWNQLRSPLQLLLFFAVAAAAASGEWVNAGIVLAIVGASAGIGYTREYRGQRSLVALRSRIDARARVMRDGIEITVPVRDLVPGDLVLLSAGNLVPADSELIEATDFFVNEAVLTGESFPVEKRPGAVAAVVPLAQRTNCVFLGTNVRSGSARCVVQSTGRGTQFGAIAHRLAAQAPETDFDRGLRRFGYLLMGIALVVVILIFSINTLLGRAPIDTLLFAVALAVGLSPELLPAILTINLARGAQSLAD